jgi:putative intracellular protease/amidase
MKVAFVVYADFTALDLVGPYEVMRARMRRLRGARSGQSARERPAPTSL